jgi:DNA polymerase-3 subunit delta
LDQSTLLNDPASFWDEIGAQSLMGGDRVVFIKSATDKITELLKKYFSKPDPYNKLIIIAASLDAKSSLRLLFEKHPQAVAIPCYFDDEKDITTYVLRTIQDNGFRMERDVAAWLASVLANGGRLKTQSELSKLMIYMGTEREIGWAHAQAVCGEGIEQNSDHLIDAVATGNVTQALRSCDAVLLQGNMEVAVVRAMAYHFKRLLRMQLMMSEEGKSVDMAMKSIYPPVFFKQVPSVKTQLGRWSVVSLMKALEKIAHAESRIKQTGLNNRLEIEHLVLTLSGGLKEQRSDDKKIQKW